MINYLWIPFAVLIGIAVYARFIEPLWIAVSHFTPIEPELPVQKLTILHLTDLHIRGHSFLEGLKLKIARRKINQLLHPLDLILVTGDFIEENRGIQAAVDFLANIPAPRYGIFACLGNHDYVNHDFQHGVFGNSKNWFDNLRLFFEQIFQNKPLRLDFENNEVGRLVANLEKAGITVLCNQNLPILIEGKEIVMLGLDDLREGKPEPLQALKGVSENDFSILLAHNPDLLLDPSLHGLNFAFSGHVHGGQIKIPLLGPFYTHGSHLPRRKPSGWFQFGKTRTFVSRGFGEGTPLRFNCRPEIAVIEIQRHS